MDWLEKEAICTTKNSQQKNQSYLAEKSFGAGSHPRNISNDYGSSHHSVKQVAALYESDNRDIDLWQPKVYRGVEKSD